MRFRRLSDLYNADARSQDTLTRVFAGIMPIPHPLHGVEYSDGVRVCGRGDCRPCRDYRKDHPVMNETDNHGSRENPTRELEVENHRLRQENLELRREIRDTKADPNLRADRTRSEDQ
jgi:hypothetical protein